MTANELADLIERCNDCGYNQDAANMLRQMGLAESIITQQSIEITDLKLYIEGQNRKILELSFELEYTKTGDAFK